MKSENHNGYVCIPYSHDHDSIELKEYLVDSRSIDELFFVTATFSANSIPYFTNSATHYILARFKKYKTVSKKINDCLLYTSPSPRDPKTSRMPSSA